MQENNKKLYLKVLEKITAITNLINKIKKYIWDKNIIMGVSIAAVVIVIFLIPFKSSNKSTEALKNPKTDYLTIQLNDISQKLNNLQIKMSNQNAVVNLDPIKDQISKLALKTKSLSEHSNEIISKQIENNTNKMLNKLSIIKAKLEKLQNEKKRNVYLKSDNLPFEVISIDNIERQNIITVSYNHKIFPLDVNDYLAGWKLISADFASQKCEFINNKKQHVLVDLNRIEQKGRV